MPTGRQKSHLYSPEQLDVPEFLVLSPALRSLDVLEWPNDPVNDLQNAICVMIYKTQYAITLKS